MSVGLGVVKGVWNDLGRLLSVLQTVPTFRRLPTDHDFVLVVFPISKVSFLSLTVAWLASLLCATAAPVRERPPLDSGIVLPEQIFPALAQILQTAAQRSPQAIRASADILIAEEMEATTRARLLPNIGGSGTYSAAQERRLNQADFASAEKLTYNFGLTQPLYHWGALKSGRKIGQISTQIAEKNHAEALRLLLLEVRQSYLRLVVEKVGLDRLRRVLALAEEDLNVVESRIEAGTLPRGELFSAQLRVEEAKLEMERSEEVFRFTKSSLERLAGIPPLADGEIPNLIPSVGVDKAGVDALLDHFIASNGVADDFRVEAMRMQVDQEKLNYRITDTALRPKINVVSGVTQDEVSYTGSPEDRARIQSFYAGINVSWTIFDGFSTRGLRRASLLRTRQLEADREARMREVVERAKNQARQVDFAQRQSAVGEARLSQLDGLVKFQEEEVQRGNMSRRDAETVALSRDEMSIRTMIFRVEYLGRLAEFLSSVGRDPTLERILPSRP